ncbi:ribonuclease H-like domain-containing protein [Syncephalastrum racemosum]|uniref:Ribonuclease H-like domain-containing protein n=1 Tax=Syncephalastrum racemosum TaxID=13706 RepID=A0A1X2HK40_SYNRA|nr:ribonuclease H-like domain-containing protein [Syncephalastrum racemosum]
MAEDKSTTVEKLQESLAGLKLDTAGSKQELKKRLRKAQKEKDQPDEEKQKPRQPFDYYMFFDVEATCIEGGGFDYPNEIIEFPVVLVDGRTFDVVDEFRSYVRPEMNTVLSKFCIELTGIQQATVDKSPVFVDVLNAFQQFMLKHDLYQTKSACFVTDGPYDIRDFITKQCDISHLAYRPEYFCRPWINLRKLFRHFYGAGKVNMEGMLDYLHMSFEGRQHSGLDDARNLARIGRRMFDDGCVFRTNIQYQQQKKTRWRRRRK